MKHPEYTHLISASLLLIWSCINLPATVWAQDMVQDMIWQELSKELSQTAKTDPVAADGAMTPCNPDTTGHASYDTISSRMAWSLPMVFDAGIPVHIDRGWEISGLAAKVPEDWCSPFENVSQKYIDSLRTATKRHLATSHIDDVCYDAATLPEPDKIEVKIGNPSKAGIKAVPTMQMGINAPPTTTNVITQKDYNYSNWKFAGRFSVQASQTFISPNWSSGGTTNNSALLSVYMTANYNDRKLIQFDNVFDLQLGFNTNASDTLRHFSVGTDQLQISSKLGVKAFDKWYYTLQAELITQMADNFEPNTNNLKSSFLSPAKLFVSLGLDYKYTDKKKNLSVLLTPITYKLNYVRENDKIDPTKYGVETGEHFGHEFGIKLSSTFNWNISDNIFWSSYIYYYSNLNYIDAEWKNTFNFTISRFFTAQVFLHTKYDDRIQRKEGQKTLFQFKDIISIGFTYHFPSFRFQ